MKSKIILVLLLSLGTFLRFYNLGWSGLVTWHPDERNMAVAVSQFRLPEKLSDLPSCFSPHPNSQLTPCNLNPHFFAYGGFPLYLSFFGGVAYESLIQAKLVRQISFPEAITTLRIASAAASTFTLYLVFLVSRLILNQSLALLITLLAVFIPGLIQSAHFGTTESLLSLLLLTIAYTLIRFFQTRNYKYLFYLCLSLGLSFATKVSVLAFLSGPLVTLFLIGIEEIRQSFKAGLLNFLINLFILCTLTITLAVLAAPFNLLALDEFRGIFNYDIPVALGQMPVFYTTQFIATVPVIFQLQKVLPYALGAALTFISLPAIILGFFYTIVKKRTSVFLLLVTFLPFLVVNLFYFTKWSRYTYPTLPFLVIMSVWFISLIHHRVIRIALLSILTILTIAQGLAFFSIYTREDNRFTASDWIFKNVPNGSTVLSETANVSDIPISAQNSQPNGYSLKNTGFNFYDLDNDKKLQDELVEGLVRSDYIFIPSRRIFKNYLRLKELYPIASSYYKNLFNGTLGFKRLAEFNSFPELAVGNYHLTINDEEAEETFTVFDHPVVRIYKKTSQLNKEEYQRLLGIETK